MITTGNKYEETHTLTTTDIAKLVRADIKAAVKAGTLPVGIYSVRTRYASMMSAIDVTIKKINCDVLNPARVYVQTDTPEDFEAISKHEIYTPEYKAVVEIMTAILTAYNRKDIDSQSDLHNVRFYESVKASYILRTNEEERIVENRPQPVDPDAAPAHDDVAMTLSADAIIAAAETDRDDRQTAALVYDKEISRFYDLAAAATAIAYMHRAKIISPCPSVFAAMQDATSAAYVDAAAALQKLRDALQIEKEPAA